jgi:hypothetical protein
MKVSVLTLRNTKAGTCVGSLIATALLVSGNAAAAQAATFKFALPGGASIVYAKASNAQAPVSQRTWQQASFHFPNGKTFGLLPRFGKSSAEGALMEPPNDSNISPSGAYVVVGRIESGTVSSGQDETESTLSREYCSVVEIRSGCVTADQTGEICGAGWQASQPAQWGTNDQTDLMLASDRPSADRLLHSIVAGQSPRFLIDSDLGADNLLRCDPQSSANREAYRKISVALRAAGAQADARLIDGALSGGSASSGDSSVAPLAGTGHPAATVSVEKATLYLSPDETHASHAYLVQGDTATVLKQIAGGWAYVDYVNSSGKHLLRWIKRDEVAILP